MTPASATGTVTFYSGICYLESANLASASASLTIDTLPFGRNNLFARYNGDFANAPALSPFAPVSLVSFPAAGFPSAAAFPVGDLPEAVAVADFNNDGYQDLAVANTGDGTVSVLLGSGNGSFGAPVSFSAGIDPVALVAADFNGDGQADLAVVANGDDAVAILLNTGGGSFGPAVEVPLGTGYSPVAITVGDWSGDGIADLAVANFDADSVSILFGRGDGSFALAPATYATGFAPVGIVAADFNRDGLTDLAVANSVDNTVSILLASSPGVFRPQSAIYAGEGPSGLIVVDLNGDGRLDLAVANAGDYQSGFDTAVAVLLGQGDGSFTPAAFTWSGFGTWAIAAGDFDGDGRMDVAVTAFDGLEVLTGNGDGSLQSPSAYPAGSSPFGFAVGQFDSSGTTAAAVTSPGDREVFVLNAAPGVCTYSLSGGPFVWDANGGPEPMTLATNSPGCPWTASSDSWITGVSAGLGGAALSAVAQPNTTGAPRSGSISIGSQTIATTEEETVRQFTDVNPGDFDFDAVDLLKNQNITSGCSATQYCPGNSTTRAQMAIFIVRAVMGGDNFSIAQQSPYFNDVPATAFGFKWIQKMYELGITGGCGGGNYCPNDPVTRAQMAIFIIRARFGGVPFDFPPAPYFSDVSSSSFGFQWIQRMRFDQITSGCSATQYCPNNPVTRGQMAVFIMRGMFNDLLAPGTPVITQISPSAIPAGQTTTVTVTGANTAFGPSTGLAAMPGITTGPITVVSATQFTVPLTPSAGPLPGPVTAFVNTTGQEAVLPNALTVQ